MIRSGCPRQPASIDACARRWCDNSSHWAILPVARAIPITGTAHACGTLVAGRDPTTSVVDAEGRVHGLDNCYVVDGSVLPRSSRVNPALTIYAWALRVASRLGVKESTHARIVAKSDPVRA